MELPRGLSKTWAHESEWVETLPRLAAECAEHWSLSLEAPFANANSLVVPAGEVVLKLNAPSHTEADNEAAALEHWDGNGAVRLVAYDEARRALLIERCLPGTQLWDVEVEETDVIADLLPRLQIEVGADHPFALVADAADRWAERVPEWYEAAGAPFERALLDAALDVYRSADRTASLLVNQDLHAGNVLRTEREPWLVIDPKPLVGERELEASGLLRNAAATAHLLSEWIDPSKRVSRWLDMLEDVGYDRDRARGWGAAHSLAQASEARGGYSGEHVDIAQRILSAP